MSGGDGDTEFDLIERILARLPEPGPRVRTGPGDDAAVTAPGGPTATSVDALVEGVHFELEQFGERAVGRKALAAGLSDMAAMGAEAGEAYVALGLPPGIDFDELCAGLEEVADRHSVDLLGGDLSRAPVLLVAVTTVGHEPSEGSFVTRGGAHPGDLVAISGELGGAAAAVRLLGDPRAGDLSETTRAALLARQLDPAARLDLGIALAAAGATAMIDVSDGLGADAGHLATASGVRIEIELATLPVQEGVVAVAGAERAGLELAASGGEDYELLSTLPPESLGAAVAGAERAGVALTVIGEVAEGSGVALRLADGGELPPSGFDHLASS